MADSLDILIRLIADVSGAKLTEEQLGKAKESLTAFANQGDASFEKVSGASDRMSFRVGQSMQRVALAAAGIDSPILRVLDRVEYLRFIADRTGLTLSQMFSRFGSGIAGVAGASVVVNQAIELAHEADAAWEAAGLSAQGFWKNLAIGYGLAIPPKVSVTVDFKEVGLKSLEARIGKIKETAEKLMHEADVVERVQNQLRPQEEELAQRQGATQPLREQAANIRTALNEPATPPIIDVESGQVMAEGYNPAQEAAKVAGVSTAGKSDEQLRAAIQEKLQALNDELKKQNDSIREYRAALDQQRESLLKQEYYAEEERKARLADLQGEYEKAGHIRETLERAKTEGALPGKRRYEEIEAEVTGASKRAADEQKLLQTDKEEQDRLRADRRQQAALAQATIAADEDQPLQKRITARLNQGTIEAEGKTAEEIDALALQIRNWIRGLKEKVAAEAEKTGKDSLESKVKEAEESGDKTRATILRDVARGTPREQTTTPKFDDVRRQIAPGASTLPPVEPVAPPVPAPAPVSGLPKLAPLPTIAPLPTVNTSRIEQQTQQGAGKVEEALGKVGDSIERGHEKVLGAVGKLDQRIKNLESRVNNNRI